MLTSPAYRSTSTATAIVIVMLAGVCRAASYSVTDLGPMSIATGINLAGQVAGYKTIPSPEHALLYSAGSIQDLGTLGGFTRSLAFGINGGGQVVGLSRIGGNPEHAFLFSGGAFYDLGRGAANAINDSGVIVGRYFFDDGSRAARLDGDDPEDLGVLPGYEGGSEAFAVNASGQIVGASQQEGLPGNAHAFLSSGGSMQDLGTLGGATSYAYGINNFGQIVGFSATAGGPNRAFLHSGGTMQDLGSLTGPTGYSYANGINDMGYVVGRSSAPPTSGFTDSAFLYRDGVMVDLNSLLVNPPCYVTNATAINDAGQIVGIGHGFSSGFESRAVLLTPIVVPEPSTFALLTAGAVGIAAFAMRRRGRRR